MYGNGHTPTQFHNLSPKSHESWSVKNYPVQCILASWLAMHNVCFTKWNKHQLLWAVARHWQCPQSHFSVHVPYAPFSETIQQLPEWQSSNLQQIGGSQTDGPVIGRVGGDCIQTQGRREGGLIVRWTEKAKAGAAVRLGVGLEEDAAEMRRQESLRALPLITRALQSSQCLEGPRRKQETSYQQATLVVPYWAIIKAFFVIQYLNKSYNYVIIEYLFYMQNKYFYLKFWLESPNLKQVGIEEMGRSKGLDTPRWQSVIGQCVDQYHTVTVVLAVCPALLALIGPLSVAL